MNAHDRAQEVTRKVAAMAEGKETKAVLDADIVAAYMRHWGMKGVRAALGLAVKQGRLVTYHTTINGKIKQLWETP